VSEVRKNTITAVITVEPADKIPFVYNCLKTRPLVTVIAICD